MALLHRKSEVISHYLRTCIQQGDLMEPLPSIRSWSQQLGVGRDNLSNALHVLEKEGLITLSRAGIRLRPMSLMKRPWHEARARMVRLIYQGFESLHEDMEWIQTLSEALNLHGIQLRLERCHASRLRALSQRPTKPTEMLVLFSLSIKYQKLLCEKGISALMVGIPYKSDLPFITLDQESAVGHATKYLLRRNFDRIDFLNYQFNTTGASRVSAAFESTCRMWPRQPVIYQTLSLPFGTTALQIAIQRYVQRIEGRRGILIYAPVPLTLVQTVLLQRGFRIPEQVQIISLFHSKTSIQVQPAPVPYSSSKSKLVKAFKSAVLHYFETGSIPALQKVISVESS